MCPSATLETSGTTLEPGGVASVPLTVRNDRDVVDEYRFRVVGPLDPWTAVEPEKVSVYPGDSATVTVLFRPPRSWEVPAGNTPYGVQVLPAQHPQDSVVAEDVVDVRAFWETSAELVPRTSEGRGGGRHRVAVDNRGNTPITVQLVPKDPEERLQLVLGAPALTIQPGTVQSADLRVRPRHRIWRGTQTAHPFTVELRPDGGPGTVLAGTHRQDPLLPGWSLKVGVVGVLLALLAVLVALALSAALSAVGPVTGFLRDCRDGILAGDPGVCLGAAPQQGQDAAGQQQDGGDQDGGGAGGEPEEFTDELTVRAGVGETDQDAFTAEENVTVLTRLVLNSSEGDTGVFNFTVDGAPFSQNVALEQLGGQEQTLDVEIRMVAGQQFQLNLLQCTTADDELFEIVDSCEVTAELEGVVVPQGG